MDVARDGGLSETARFLALRAPFDALAPEELGRLVAQTEIEFHPAGTAILTEDGGPVTFLRVVHSGAVDITHDGRLLDLLGPGDTFGHAAMMSGLPPGFEASAAEDTLCYRIPVAVARPLLDRARSRELAVGVHEPGHQPVARLIRSPTVRCAPTDTIGDLARRMTEHGASAAIVDLADGQFGIVTDRDLRSRALATGLPSSATVEHVMTTPVFTVPPDRLGGEVLFELLERGIRHAPVLSERGRLIGVVEDGDLFAVQPKSWFGARRSIARAKDTESLAALANKLPDVVVDLHRSNLRAIEVVRVLSALVDAVTVRALELVPDERLPADGLVWVAVGSQARRELTPASVPRGTLIATEPLPPEWISSVHSTLQRCGIRADTHTPEELRVDRRALWGTPREPLPTTVDHELLQALANDAREHPPPTGFDGEAVLDATGARSDTLDIRAAAISPIVALARWAGATAGSFEGSTLERLRAGALPDGDTATLGDAFELALELRLAHHAEQLAKHLAPDDQLNPATLSPLTRDHLRDVFHAIAAVQRRVGE
jgi:CBS domain-containing protein